MMRRMSTYITNTKTKTNKCLVASLVAVLGLVAGGARVAHADDDGGRGFVELAIGEMSPLGDDEWDSKHDGEAKFALHGGTWARHGLGFELGLDYTGLGSGHAEGFGESVDSDYSRFRLLIGGRGGAPIAHNLRAFGRFLVGADYVRSSVEWSGPVDGSHVESDVGLGVEIGGGILYSLGDAFSVGAQIAVPMAFHFSEQNVDLGNLDDAQFEDFEYNSYDVDLMLTVATAF
jgi:hypothetical protein